MKLYSTSLKTKNLHKFFRVLLHRSLSILPQLKYVLNHLLYHYGLLDIHFLLWVISKTISFVDQTDLWWLGIQVQLVPVYFWQTPIIVRYVLKMFLLFGPVRFSYIFPAPVWESVFSLRSPIPFFGGMALETSI